MKIPALYDFMDLRKPLSHISYLIFSLLVTIILSITGRYPDASSVSLAAFFLIFFQLEAFIYLGNRIFASVRFDESPGKITRTIVIRLTVFLSGCLLVSMILFILIQYFAQLLKGEVSSDVLKNFFQLKFREWFRSTITGLMGGAVLFIIVLWQSSLKREQKLREQNLIFQNETLKNQVNPHFLFNSLNTLSALITSKPDTAEKFITGLSSIYRYILENSRKDKVPLNSELTFIKDYFDLQKVRDEEKIVLKKETPETTDFMILPVSLQILVENAFKHNMATRENPLTISIYIDNQYIVVKNNLQKMPTQLKSSGIGLNNLAERTRLITGRDIIIEESDKYFTVKVPLIK
jgi:sensor histidine kinase YesM